MVYSVLYSLILNSVNEEPIFPPNPTDRLRVFSFPNALRYPYSHQLRKRMRKSIGLNPLHSNSESARHNPMLASSVHCPVSKPKRFRTFSLCKSPISRNTMLSYFTGENSNGAPSASQTAIPSQHAMAKLSLFNSFS